MKRWTPPLFRICVFLLLGAIVNVAVAWGCVLCASEPSDVERGWVSERDMVELRQSIPRASRIPAGDLRGNIMIRAVAFGLESDYLTASGIDNWRGPERAIFIQRDSVAAGWPVRSLEGSLWETHLPDGVQESFNELALQASPYVLKRGGDHWGYLFRRILPLRPIWPGFAINTIFYAAILWLLFAAPFALRRRRRVRRGLCPRCAYDLRGSASQTCPECG